MSTYTKIRTICEELYSTHESKISSIPLNRIQKLQQLVEESLVEIEQEIERENNSDIDDLDEDSSEDNSFSNESNTIHLKNATTKGGRWSKKRFNRIKDLSKKEEDSEDSNPVQIEIPSSSTKSRDLILMRSFELLRDYWEVKIDPILEILSQLQTEDDESLEVEEKKPIPISVQALKEEEQLLIGFVDIYVDWASLGIDDDAQEESILWRVACYLHFLGQSNLDTLHAMLQLGMLYRERSEFVLSEQVLANTLYKLSDSQGEDAPPTLQAALQLTLLYNKAGQFEDALDIGEELVEALEDNFGAEAGETLLGVLACADALVGLGEVENAGEILEELLPAMEQVFGGLHEEMLKTELLWATVLVDMESVDEAMDIMQNRVDRIASEYGTVSIETIEALEEWAELTIDAEDIETATEMYEQTLEWRTELMNRSLQNGDFDGEEEFAESILSPALLQLANISMENGEYNEALQVFEKVLRLEEKIDLQDAREDGDDEENSEEDDIISDSIETALTRKMYADCLSTIGRIHEARVEYNKALEVIQMHRGEEVDEVLDIYEALEALPTTPEFSVIVGENDEDGSKREKGAGDSQVIKGRFHTTKEEDSEE